MPFLIVIALCVRYHFISDMGDAMWRDGDEEVDVESVDGSAIGSSPAPPHTDVPQHASHFINDLHMPPVMELSVLLDSTNGTAADSGDYDEDQEHHSAVARVDATQLGHSSSGPFQAWGAPDTTHLNIEASDHTVAHHVIPGLTTCNSQHQRTNNKHYKPNNKRNSSHLNSRGARQFASRTSLGECDGRVLRGELSTSDGPSCSGHESSNTGVAYVDSESDTSDTDSDVDVLTSVSTPASNEGAAMPPTDGTHPKTIRTSRNLYQPHYNFHMSHMHPDHKVNLSGGHSGGKQFVPRNVPAQIDPSREYVDMEVVGGRGSRSAHSPLPGPSGVQHIAMSTAPHAAPPHRAPTTPTNLTLSSDDDSDIEVVSVETKK